MDRINRIDWTAIDPLLRGPYPARDGAVLFEVPGDASAEFSIARISSGEAWPEDLAPVDRLAAVPAVERGALSAHAGAVVLYVETPHSDRMPLCARPSQGLIRWSVDPVAWVRGLLREAYVRRWTRPITSRLPLVNYNRLPHALKGFLQKVQDPRSHYGSNPTAFPETPLDDLVETIRSLCARLATGSGVRSGDLWPRGCRAAVTLTHDVDTGWILDGRRARLLREILDLESSLGYRAAWYITANQFSPKRHAPAVDMIREAGHEVGCHGWNHDSRLAYLSPDRQEERARKMRRRLDGLGVEGIRTPWYARTPALSEVLSRHFGYDSSVPNASGYFSSGSNSGCCTLFPYRIAERLYELPMTLPPDTSLHPTEGYAALDAIAAKIVERGGVVLVTLHPQPHQSGNRERLRPYYEFLREFAGRHADRVWQACPRDVIRHYASRMAA